LLTTSSTTTSHKSSRIRRFEALLAQYAVPYVRKREGGETDRWGEGDMGQEAGRESEEEELKTCALFRALHF
jgi:hypothetical protein